MKIFRCIKTSLITQTFGKQGTSPALLSMYESLGMQGHDGWDFLVKCKDTKTKHGGQCESVYFDLDCKATITNIVKDDSSGYGITAMSQDKDGEFKHIWWHFDIINPDLKIGSVLESGDLLGVAGNTGMSTGAHCHRGLYAFNEPYNNGFRGAVDLSPYYVNEFICDYKAKLEAQVGILSKLVELFKLLFGK